MANPSQLRKASIGQSLGYMTCERLPALSHEVYPPVQSVLTFWSMRCDVALIHRTLCVELVAVSVFKNL